MPAVRPVAADDVPALTPALADILVDCVAGGASLGFMNPFTHGEAEAYWGDVAHDMANGGTVLLIAETDDALLGTVQLGLASKPNQRHRADVKKLLVHSRARRQGAGRALMLAAEREALARGRWLLCLDSATGSDAERMYPRLGWTSIGAIPDYAMWPGGGFCDSTFFHKCLDPERRRG